MALPIPSLTNQTSATSRSGDISAAGNTIVFPNGALNSGGGIAGGSINGLLWSVAAIVVGSLLVKHLKKG